MEKTINLINSCTSEVKYTLTTFPDGEPHIKFSEEINRKCNYNIHCRITNPSDLFVLAQVCDILNRSSVDFNINIFYLMSMRMDRVITFEESFTLKLVADVINSFGAKNVFVLEPHSEKTLTLIHNCHVFIPKVFDTQGCIVCYPDAGAMTRYSAGYDCICLEKTRDLKNNGKLTGMKFSHIGENIVGDTILVRDDLCDGGGTFVLAAKLLREKFPDKKLSIFVNHMVNPRGIENLSVNYDDVYFTNSYKNWDNLPLNCHLIEVV